MGNDPGVDQTVSTARGPAGGHPQDAGAEMRIGLVSGKIKTVISYQR